METRIEVRKEIKLKDMCIIKYQMLLLDFVVIRYRKHFDKHTGVQQNVQQPK